MHESAMRVAGSSTKSLPRKINFTVEALARLACPAGKDRTYVYDARTPGLAYVVTATGAAAFYLVRKVRGRAQRVRLGGREITIDQARTIAAKMNGRIADGADPAAEKRSVRQSDTLQALWDRWFEDHAKLRLAERTRETDESRFDTCFAEWKTRQILNVSEADVRALHTKIGKSRGHVTANRAVQLLRKLYNFARIGHNPAAKAVDLFRERSRDRFIQPDEMPKLFAALDADETNPIIRDFVYLSLWTGARRSNVCSMEEKEIDLKARVWTIPASKTKAGEPIKVPLVDAAVAIIERRKGDASGFIFPGPGKTGHLVEPKATWAAIVKRAGLADLRIHDLRRSMGSYQAILGASLPIIGASLGHQDTAATAIYSRLHLDPVRASVTAAAAAMLGTVAQAKAKAKDPAKGKGPRKAKGRHQGKTSARARKVAPCLPVPTV